MTSSFVSPQQQGLIPFEETVRWSGAPPAGMKLRRSDLAGVPISLMILGFAAYWDWTAIDRGFPIAVVFGAPLDAIALYLVAGRFFWDAYVRAHTQYVVTDRAAYVVTAGIGATVRRFAGAELADVGVEPDGTGGGTLRFGSDASFVRLSYPGRTSPPVTGFEAVADLEGARAAVLAARDPDAHSG